jgi:F0F1-type ATP synthase assembly protein I
VTGQAGAAAAAGLLFWSAGSLAMGAAAYGGMVVALGSAVFGWRLFAPGVAPVARLARSLFLAEVQKWLLTALALWFALAQLKLPGLPLLSGMLAAHAATWIGMARIK